MKKAFFIMLGLTIVGAKVICAHELLDPDTPVKPTSVNKPLPLVDGQTSSLLRAPNLPDPSVARNMADQTIEALNNLTGQFENNANKVQNLEANLANMRQQFTSNLSKIDQEIQDKQNKRDLVLNEMRRGAYCSQCKRSKTEIEATGESFYQHLQRVHGQEIPAPYEDIVAKQREYDDAISQLNSQRSAIVNRYNTEYPREAQRVAQIKTETFNNNQLIFQQIVEGYKFWQTATALEKNLLAAHEHAVQEQQKADIKFASDKLRQVEANQKAAMKKGPLNTAAKKTFNDAIALWQAQKERALNADKNRLQTFWSEMQEMDKRNLAQWSVLSDTTRRVNAIADNNLPYLGSGAFDLPHAGIKLTTPQGEVSIASSPDSLGINFELGKIGKIAEGSSIGLSAGRSTTSTEVKAFIELFKTIKIEAGWKTQFTPSGVVSGPTANIEVHSPMDKSDNTPLNLDPPVSKQKPDLPLN